MRTHPPLEDMLNVVECERRGKSQTGTSLALVRLEKAREDGGSDKVGSGLYVFCIS